MQIIHKAMTNNYDLFNRTKKCLIEQNNNKITSKIINNNLINVN